MSARPVHYAIHWFIIHTLTTVSASFSLILIVTVIRVLGLSLGWLVICKDIFSFTLTLVVHLCYIRTGIPSQLILLHYPIRLRVSLFVLYHSLSSIRICSILSRISSSLRGYGLSPSHTLYALHHVDFTRISSPQGVFSLHRTITISLARSSLALSYVSFDSPVIVRRP